MNRKLVYYVAQSLDGHIADDKNSVAWLDAFNGLGTDFGYEKFLSGIGCLIMGGETYRFCAALKPWPYAKLPSLVVTRSEVDASLPGVRKAQGDARLTVAAARALCPPDKDIWLLGGGQCASLFLREDLIDELILSVMPVVLGAGRPLFGCETLDAKAFELIRSEACPGGVLQLTYRRK